VKLHLWSKLILLVLGTLSLQAEQLGTSFLIVFLGTVTLTLLNAYFQQRPFSLFCSLASLLFSWFSPVGFAFLPLMIFDFLIQFPRKYLPLLAVVLIERTWNHGFFVLIYLLAVAMAGVLLSELLERIESLAASLRSVRDTYTEQDFKLKQRNKELLEKQDYEVHLATLEERNRIARDIHDHVGHGLSRAILQTGALQALNGDDKLFPFLTGLQETLTESMNNIRGSVHDLKDDAVDLQEAIKKILAEVPYGVQLSYDLNSSVPNPVKYCFLTVLKEAITNATKHSDATQLEVTLQEHPALYQFLIADNGTTAPAKKERGIGLQNIEERVQNLGGYCSFTYENGFRIFMTVPKEN